MAAQDRETIGDESLENWKELGLGGFACVYKASHKDWGFDVAIKLPHVGSGTFSTALGREARHMDTAAFVPKVYGMYQGIPPVPKLGYMERQGIVMELMERGSLLSLLKALSGPPPWALAFRLANQVAVAMNFLHSKKTPVVHLDLKPDNVLLDAYLDAKIADFGLSMVYHIQASVHTSNKGDEGGSLAYTPPEAFEQDDYRPVRSYDVYSYGMLLWTILTGNWEPYPAGVNRDVLIFRIIIKGQRPDLHKIDQSKADGLEELVDLMQRCWDKDPTKRPTFKGCTEVTGRVFSNHQKGIKAAVNETLTKLDSVNRQEECVRPPGHAATKATEDRPPTKPVPQADTPGPMRTRVVYRPTALLHPTTAPKSAVNDSPSVPPGSTNRKDYLKHFSHLTLNTNTAHSDFSLSENNMVVTQGRTGPPPHHHPDRFDFWAQVLCTEGLTGPCYWEVERNGWVSIAVTYGGISRKGGGYDSLLGWNDKSWSLICDDSYRVTHNSKETVLPVRPSRLSWYSRRSKRVAVYLDCPLGNLSFYEVCSDSLTHLYTFTFHNTSSEPLYAGFRLHSPWSSSSVRLCEQR